MNKVKVSFSYDPETDRLLVETEGNALEVAITSAVYMQMATENAVPTDTVRSLRELVCEIIMDAPLSGCVRGFSRVDMKAFRDMLDMLDKEEKGEK